MTYYISYEGLNDEWYVMEKETGRRGIYTKDGTLLRESEVLPKEEVAYRIWRQGKSPAIAERKLREMFVRECEQRGRNHDVATDSGKDGSDGFEGS